MSQNHFSKVMAKKSDSELERVVNSPSTFAEEARLAAALELNNRGTVTEEIEQIGQDLETKLESKRDEQKFKDKFISKNFIYGFAIILTPLLIGPFMAVNIWTLGNRKGMWIVLLISVLYLPLIILIANIIPEGLNVFVITIFHAFYVILFVEWTWDKYLPSYEQHKSEKTDHNKR